MSVRNPLTFASYNLFMVKNKLGIIVQIHDSFFTRIISQGSSDSDSEPVIFLL